MHQQTDAVYDIIRKKIKPEITILKQGELNENRLQNRR